MQCSLSTWWALAQTGPCIQMCCAKQLCRHKTEVFFCLFGFFLELPELKTNLYSLSSLLLSVSIKCYGRKQSKTFAFHHSTICTVNKRHFVLLFRSWPPQHAFRANSATWGLCRSSLLHRLVSSSEQCAHTLCLVLQLRWGEGDYSREPRKPPVAPSRSEPVICELLERWKTRWKTYWQHAQPKKITLQYQGGKPKRLNI